MFVMVRNVIRIVLLNYKLKIVFWKDVFHPIFICVLSIAQNITALFKIWLKKKNNHFSSNMIRVKDYIKQLNKIDEFNRSEAQLTKLATEVYDVEALKPNGTL